MLARLLERTDREKFQPRVIVLRGGGPVEARIRALDVRVDDAGLDGGGAVPAALWRLWRWVRDFEPDLIQGWMVYGSLAAQVVRRVARRPAPAVWNLRHSLDATRVERRRTVLIIRRMAKLSRRARAVIYNSRTSARQHEAIGYDARRTVVIPNGFDTSVYRPDARARAEIRGELNLEEGTRLVGLVARYHPVKDHRMFLEAAARLAAAHEGVHFVLAGRGTESAEMAARIGGAGLAGRVHTLGERADTERIAAALDLATCSSMSESFPNAIGEAMACGVPCVSTNVGDAAYLMGETGRVVEPGNPEALEAAWREMLSLDEGRLRRMGEAGRERIRRHFSIEQIARRYQDLYGELAGFSPAADGRDSRRLTAGAQP